MPSIAVHSSGLTGQLPWCGKVSRGSVCGVIPTLRSQTILIDGLLLEVHFAFGMDAMPNLVKIAEGLESSCWQELKRRRKQPASGQRRQRPKNVKEEIVAEFSYQPTKCKRSYRVIVLRKSISIEEGQRRLWDEVRYFFYITNIPEDGPGRGGQILQ